MSKAQEVAEFRVKAAKYRALARASNDDATAQEIFTLAAQLEKQARDLDESQKVVQR